MKKITILIVALVSNHTILTQSLIAQTTTSTIQQTTHSTVALDEKTQKKVDKARTDLEKDKKTLAKAEVNYKKDQQKYDKKKSKGKLSPDDEVKVLKAKEKAEKGIEKLKKKIAENEAILEKYKM